MRFVYTCLVAGLLSVMPATATFAQMEGSDAAYREERRVDRSERRMWKLGISGAILLVGGGIWAVKKMRGTAK